MVFIVQVIDGFKFKLSVQTVSLFAIANTCTLLYVMCRDARHAFDVMSPNYIAVENLLPHGRPSKHYDHRQ